MAVDTALRRVEAKPVYNRDQFFKLPPHKTVVSLALEDHKPELALYDGRMYEGKLVFLQRADPDTIEQILCLNEPGLDFDGEGNVVLNAPFAFHRFGSDGQVPRIMQPRSDYKDTTLYQRFDNDLRGVGL